MADGSASGSGRPHGNAPARRPSYASVASAAAQQSAPVSATRSGLFASRTGASPNSTNSPFYASDSQTQRRQAEQGQDAGVQDMASKDARKMPSLPEYSRKYATITKHGPNTFFIPSYLKNSRYAAKLEAAHAAKSRAQRERSSSTQSLGTSAGNTNTQRMAPSHRGMTYDIIESNAPKEEDEITPLPSRWNNQDKYPGMDVTNDGLDVKYNGSAGKAETEAASVRADNFMSPACGIYYYEVEIKQKSKDCAVAVGFATLKASLERLPGWEGDSWAYHGDDGRSFSGDHQGRNYATPFAQGDVIGCGLNFHTGQAFFTKNGSDLGIAFRELKHLRPFPAVGIKKYSGAIVSVNFGQKPFVYDIDNRVERERDLVRRQIKDTKTDSLHPSVGTHSFVQDLVAQFLSHGGYVETAEAFANDRWQEQNALNDNHISAAAGSEQDNTGAVHRQQIRRAILNGDIDEALEVTNARFPDVLRQSPGIVFRLKCRKWVELIARASDLRARQTAYLEQVPQKSRNGRTTVPINAVEDVFDQHMELDDDQQHSGGTNSGQATVPSPLDIDSDLAYNALLSQAMAYGQDLQREYRDAADKDYKKTLENIFSLVAYDEPRESVHGHLLDADDRIKVAEELNSAVLVLLGRSPMAALEKIYRQTESLIDVLSQDGGPASFVNLKNDFSS